MFANSNDHRAALNVQGATLYIPKATATAGYGLVRADGTETAISAKYARTLIKRANAARNSTGDSVVCND